MNAARLIRSRGASLIDVMLAVALTAITAVGLIASQLWITHEASAAALREHAGFLADAVAEAAHTSLMGDAPLRLWSARAASLLPHGEASISERGGAIFFGRVTWSAVNNLAAPGELIDKPDSCGDTGVPAGMACVAVAFAK